MRWWKSRATMLGVLAVALLVVVYSGAGDVRAAAAEPAGSAVGAPTSGPEVRIVLQSNTALQYVGFYVASANGYFAQHGVKVSEPIVVTSGSDAARLLLTNQADMDISGLEVVGALQAGATDAVSIIARYDTATVDAFLGPKSINGLNGLKGKRIAIGAASQTSAIVIQNYLDQALGKGNWQPVFISGGSTARIAAMKAGQADAILVVPPNDVSAENKDSSLHTIFVTPNIPVLSGAIFLRSAFGKANPTVVKNWLRAYLQGCAFAHDPANRTATLSILSKQLGVPASELAYIYERTMAPRGDNDVYGPRDSRVPLPALQNGLDDLLQAGIVRTPVQAASVVDNTYVQGIK